MKNNQIMIVVVVLLVGVVAMLVYDRAQEPQTPGEAIGQAVEQIGDDVSEASEEVRDEIDDHTTTR